MTLKKRPAWSIKAIVPTAPYWNLNNMEKNKTKKLVKEQIALLTAVMIGAAVIGHFGQKLENQAHALTIPTLPERRASLTKIVPPKAIDEKIKVVKLLSDNPSVEVKIREIAKAEGFKWPDYLVRLANCESRLDPTRTNTQGNKPSWSKDRGIFQFNSHWQKRVSDECSYDIECATKTAIKMINAGKQHLWVCDSIIKKQKV